MNKKGQGLPLNTVVIAILVIVVLILVITFFFGGFTSLSAKIREVFYGGLAGTSKTMAIQNCEHHCSQLQLRRDPGDDSLRQTLFKESTFCAERNVDLNENGKIDSGETMNCVDLRVSCNYERPNGDSMPVTC